jgi:hypothetical protein
VEWALFSVFAAEQHFSTKLSHYFAAPPAWRIIFILTTEFIQFTFGNVRRIRRAGHFRWPNP